MAYLHAISQIPGFPRYTGDIIISCTLLKILPIEKDELLEAAQFMVDFRLMHFNADKDLYINFQNLASIFRNTMLSTINGGGRGRCYVLPKIMCATIYGNYQVITLFCFNNGNLPLH